MSGYRGTIGWKEKIRVALATFKTRDGWLLDDRLVADLARHLTKALPDPQAWEARRFEEGLNDAGERLLALVTGAAVRDVTVSEPLGLAFRAITEARDTKGCIRCAVRKARESAKNTEQEPASTADGG